VLGRPLRLPRPTPGSRVFRREIMLRGRRVRYRETGAGRRGRVVVLLHGPAGSPAAWSAVLPLPGEHVDVPASTCSGTGDRPDRPRCGTGRGRGVVDADAGRSSCHRRVHRPFPLATGRTTLGGMTTPSRMPQRRVPDRVDGTSRPGGGRPLEQLSPGERRDRAHAALAALGPRHERTRLEVRCASGHHVAAVMESPDGLLIYATTIGPHSHGSNDRVDTGHGTGAHGRPFVDFLDTGDIPNQEDDLPAGCECGPRTLSRTALTDAVAKRARHLLVD